MQLFYNCSRNPSKLYVKEFVLETLKYCLQKVTPLHVFLKAIDIRSGYRLAIIVEDLLMTVSGF